MIHMGTFLVVKHILLSPYYTLKQKAHPETADFKITPLSLCLDMADKQEIKGG